MNLKLEKKYEELNSLSKVLTKIDLEERKRKILTYFERIGIDTTGIRNNLGRATAIFTAPLRKIYNSSLVCWPINKKHVELYIDEEHYENYPELASAQITHEVLHSMAQFRGEIQSWFMHGKACIGIDEATTQMYMEDINGGRRFTEQEDYLYFIKNIMRVMKATIGEKELASQYTNVNDEFERKFNMISGGKFSEFSESMTELYKLLLEQKYNGVNNREILQIKERKMLLFVTHFVEQVISSDPDVINRILREFQGYPQDLERMGLTYLTYLMEDGRRNNPTDFGGIGD